VFGKRINNSFAIGTTPLRDPEFNRRIRDGSTGNERWIDIYLPQNLKRWNDFIAERIAKGDPEPKIEYLNDVNIPWLGECLN
jgi:hypothetical protein